MTKITNAKDRFGENVFAFMQQFINQIKDDHVREELEAALMRTERLDVEI